MVTHQRIAPWRKAQSISNERKSFHRRSTGKSPQQHFDRWKTSNSRPWNIGQNPFPSRSDRCVFGLDISACLAFSTLSGSPFNDAIDFRQRVISHNDWTIYAKWKETRAMHLIGPMLTGSSVHSLQSSSCDLRDNFQYGRLRCGAIKRDHSSRWSLLFTLLLSDDPVIFCVQSIRRLLRVVSQWSGVKQPLLQFTKWKSPADNHLNHKQHHPIRNAQIQLPPSTSRHPCPPERVPTVQTKCLANELTKKNPVDC